jgi:hypothetical protein
MPILWKLFDFIANNKTVQWVLGVFAAFSLYKIYERLRDNRIRKEANAEIIEAIQEETDDAIERVEQERERVADLNDAERLRLAAESPNNRGRLQNPEAD